MVKYTDADWQEIFEEFKNKLNEIKKKQNF
jgi:hypothetical protein